MSRLSQFIIYPLLQFTVHLHFEVTLNTGYTAYKLYAPKCNIKLIND